MHLLHWNPDEQEYDNEHEVGPGELLEVVHDIDGDEGGISSELSGTAMFKWERAHEIPEHLQVDTLRDARRKGKGGNADRLYWNLVKQGLKTKSIPDTELGEEEEDDIQCGQAPPARVRGVASPLPAQPSEEDIQRKKELETLAAAHPGWIEKARRWKEDFKKFMSNLKSGGWTMERDENDVPQACMDRGAAIKEGKKKAAEKRKAAAEAGRGPPAPNSRVAKPDFRGCTKTSSPN